MDLVDAGTIDNATEYHINNWTEEWHSDRELMEQFVVNIELSLPSFQVTSIDQYSEAIINAYNEGKFIIGYIRFAGGTVVCPLDMIEGSSIYFQPVLRFFNNGVLMTYATRLTVTTSSANLALMRILTEEDYDAIATELNDVLKGVGVRLTNNEAIDEGQNTRLDIAEGNIDAIVGTVNTLSSNLSKTMKMVYDGSSGGSSAYKDTGLPIEAGYGGGAYLVTMTWHLSSGDPTGTTVDIISLPYSGTNFTTYRICELRNNANYSKHLLYQASENKTLMIGVGGSGDAKIHIYKL